VLARALMHGIVSMEHFSDAAVRDPAARAMAARVYAAADPTAEGETGGHFFCRLRITTAGGETVEHLQNRPIGRDKDHPLPPGALEAKFRDCARLVLDAPAIESLVGLVGALETLPDVASVTDAIAGGVKTAESLTDPHPEERAQRASRRMAARSEPAAMVRDGALARASSP